MLHYFISLCALKNMTKTSEWKKHDLRLCNLADIIQSFCRGPNPCLMPVYTSYCISNLRLSWLVFEEAVLKSHSSLPLPNSKLFLLPWDVWFRTQSWSKSLADYFMRSLLIWDKGARDSSWSINNLIIIGQCKKKKKLWLKLWLQSVCLVPPQQHQHTFRVRF